MSVGLLLVTHGDICRSLLDTTTALLGKCPLQTHCLSVPLDCDPDSTHEEVEESVSRLDTGDGVLIVTDIFGATPCNIVSRLEGNSRVHIITGLNLPMLVRIFNYPTLDLEQLGNKALGGGKEGVMNLGKGSN